MAQVAKQQGKHAARNVLRLHRRRSDDAVPLSRSRATWRPSAAPNAIADFGWARVSGFLGWLLWLFVHILFLIGFRNRLSVLLQWATAYLTYQRSVRLITGRHAAQGGTSDSTRVLATFRRQHPTRQLAGERRRSRERRRR